MSTDTIETDVPADFVAAFAQTRAELVEQLEAMDSWAFGALVVFQHAHPELVPCGFPTWQGEPIWKVSAAYDHGIEFTHQCMDHGYDLHDMESVFVPAAFLHDSEAWGVAHAAEVAKNKTAADARATAERRAQYEALRTEFESKSR